MTVNIRDLTRSLTAKQRRLAVLTALGGAVLVVVGWVGGGGWQSVAIEIGASLALVVLILVVEESWRAGVGEQLDEIKREVDELRTAPTSLKDAQDSYRRRRASSDEELISAWIDAPGPATMWAVEERRRALGCAGAEQVVFGDAVVHVTAVDENHLQLLVVQRTSSGGGPSRKILTWDAGVDIETAVAWIEESMASLNVHPGEGFEIGEVFESLGEIYRQKIAARFASPTA